MQLGSVQFSWGYTALFVRKIGRISVVCSFVEWTDGWTMYGFKCKVESKVYLFISFIIISSSSISNNCIIIGFCCCCCCCYCCLWSLEHTTYANSKGSDKSVFQCPSKHLKVRQRNAIWVVFRLRAGGGSTLRASWVSQTENDRTRRIKLLVVKKNDRTHVRYMFMGWSIF